MYFIGFPYTLLKEVTISSLRRWSSLSNFQYNSRGILILFQPISYSQGVKYKAKSEEPEGTLSLARIAKIISLLFKVSGLEGSNTSNTLACKAYLPEVTTWSAYIKAACQAAVASLPSSRKRPALRILRRIK